MARSDLTTEAKQLLARRSAPSSPWFYISRDWRRQVLFLAAYVVIPIVLWFLGMTAVALAAACFFAGIKFRDIRWWIALAKEWPTTTELLDWPKIETIANRSADP